MDAGVGLSVGLGVVAYSAGKDVGSPWPHDPLFLAAGCAGANTGLLADWHSRRTAAYAPCALAPLGGEVPMPSSLLSTNTKETSAPITLILKNIPSRCTNGDLLRAIESAGFRGKFDFLYLPLKPHKFTQNRGYAFVGFQGAENARSFCACLTGVRVSVTSAKEIWLEQAQENRTLQEVRACTKTRALHSQFGSVLVLASTDQGEEKY